MYEQSEIAMPQSNTTLHGAEATSFLVTVYMWMFAGLLLTAAVAWYVASSPSIYMAIAGSKFLFWGLIIAELGLVVVLSAGINKISGGLATLLFMTYSAVNGATLSFILLVYSGESIAMAFLSAACLFGTMSIYGYVTRRDLTAWGNLLFIGLIAVVVCSLINLFIGSSAFDFMISIVGVVVFLGLTAYDTQKILRHGSAVNSFGPEAMRKVAIIGALALYLDFINLFLYMLRFMGRKK